MPGHQLNIATCVVIAAHLALVFWVVLRRRGMWPVLAVNSVVAVSVLWFAASSVPHEIAFAWSDPDSGWFDYKNTILTVFETAILLASLVAFVGLRLAKIVAWLGFAGNFGLMVFLLTLKFEFKCCGYL
jgi:hypothetical protein